MGSKVIHLSRKNISGKRRKMSKSYVNTKNDKRFTDPDFDAHLISFKNGRREGWVELELKILRAIIEDGGEREVSIDKIITIFEKGRE